MGNSLASILPSFTYSIGVPLVEAVVLSQPDIPSLVWRAVAFIESVGNGIKDKRAAIFSTSCYCFVNFGAYPSFLFYLLDR